jgi:RNA polymerase sigma-70 factor (ECF subfamily)
MHVPLALAREDTSIDRVYREHGPRLLRSLIAYSGDRAIAEDAMAEAFAQAIRRGSALLDPERWVWRTAYRIAAGALKERSHFTSDQAERSYVLPEVSDSLAQALADLPEGQRAAVILYYYIDLPAREVARVLGTSSASVRVSLMRARRRLRTLLEVSDG